MAKLKVFVSGDEIEVDSESWKSESGSITPTTHTRRDFLSEDASFFIDSFFSDIIKRFGISEELSLEEFTLKNDLPAVTLSASAGAGGDTPAAPPSSFTGKSSRSKFNRILSQIKHTQVEFDVMKMAIEHLFSDASIRTVLVDVLERDAIDLKIEGYKVKTHTVVLYKNPAEPDGKHEVVVIDPSNPTFSAHLTNDNMKEGISIEKIEEVSEIKALYPSKRPEQYKIYVAHKDGKIGAEKNEFRDCVDIAAKIAFGLSSDGVFYEYNSRLTLSGRVQKILDQKAKPVAEEGSSGTSAAAAAASSGSPEAASGNSYYKLETFEDLVRCPVIRAIERGGEISSDFITSSANPCRIRQSSNFIDSIKFNRIKDVIEKYLITLPSSEVIEIKETIFNSTTPMSDSSCIAQFSKIFETIYQYQSGLDIIGSCSDSGGE